jgi:hypothetical protein
MDIDLELGGIEIAAGLHRGAWLHDRETKSIQAIPEDRIPPAACRYAEYHPGDVLVFGEFMPHTGMPNRTDRGLYRLSFDVRFYRLDDRGYFQGMLAARDDDSVTIECDDGIVRRLRIGPEVVLRSKSGETMKGDDLGSWQMAIGEPVMASSRDDDAIYVRPVKFKFPTPPAK